MPQLFTQHLRHLHGLRLPRSRLHMYFVVGPAYKILLSIRGKALLHEILTIKALRLSLSARIILSRSRPVDQIDEIEAFPNLQGTPTDHGRRSRVVDATLPQKVEKTNEAEESQEDKTEDRSKRRGERLFCVNEVVVFSTIRFLPCSISTKKLLQRYAKVQKSLPKSAQTAQNSQISMSLLAK